MPITMSRASAARFRHIGISFAFAMTTNVCSAVSAAPDISGTYWATTYSAKIQTLGGGEPPLNEAGKAAYEKKRAGLASGSIVDKARMVCVPDGLPRVLATPYPFEIFQVPVDQVTFVYEMNHQIRVIALDKPLPTAHRLLVEPLYNGHSVGRWNGDTLIVESAGFNDWTFLDAHRPAAQRGNAHYGAHPQDGEGT